MANRRDDLLDAAISVVCPLTPAELAQALVAFAHDATGPHRTLTLARYAILVEAAIYPPLRAPLTVGPGCDNDSIKADQAALVGREPENDAPAEASAAFVPFPDEQRQPFQRVAPDLAEAVGGVAVPEVRRPSAQEPVDVLHHRFDAEQQASLDAADRSVARHFRRLTLGFDPTRFQTGPPACYRAPWRLPDRTFTGKQRRAYE